MSLGFGMGSGMRALTAARLGMQTAGNNVANANTVGYSRQRVELSAAMPYSTGSGLQIGSGVDVRSISRLVNQGLERRMQTQLGLVGAAELDQARMSEIEGILSEPEGGLSDSLAGLFGSIDQLRTDPSDRALRGGVIQSGSLLSQGFRLMSQRFEELGGSTFNEVRGLARQVNEHATAVAELNKQIVSVEANGSQANDLRDSRDQHIKELSKLLDTNAIERSSGSVDVLVGGHLLVAGDRATLANVDKDADGQVKLHDRHRRREPHQGDGARSGRIAALLRQQEQVRRAGADRAHRRAGAAIRSWSGTASTATGMPRVGPVRVALRRPTAASTATATASHGDELLAQAGCMFDVQERLELYVSVTNKSDRRHVERTRLDIDPA
jgi:flagellar hook-associated protein 1 FlgK